MIRSTSHRWLELAARAKQWELDEERAALLEALACEKTARDTLTSSTRSLAAAGGSRHDLMSRATFRAAELTQQAMYETRLNALMKSAEKVFDEATDNVEKISTEMRDIVSQRDGYRRRFDQFVDRWHLHDTRTAERELDELWLLRRQGCDGESRNED